MKKYYFVGISGVSMSSLAMFLISEGHQVKGYDKKISPFLVENGVEIDQQEDFQKIDWADEIVYSSAFNLNFPLIDYALKIKKIVKVRGQCLAEMAQNYQTVVAVAGSHGKSTVTAMIYNILKFAGKQPSLHVGANLVESGKNYDVSDKDFFVTEACEYHDNFLFLHPSLSVVTNLESEHLDYFKSFAREQKSFNQFIKQSQLCILKSSFKAKRIKAEAKCVKFDVYKDEKFLMSLKLKIGGVYNVQNALLAIQAARALGINYCYIKCGLENFLGLQKRFEHVNATCSATVILDYAHHPREIKSVFESVKKIKAKKIAVFQPHTYSRTQAFLNDFVKTLSQFDEVVLFKTFAAREEENFQVEIKLISLLSKNKKTSMFYDVCALIDKLKTYRKGDVVCIMGAGNLPELLKHQNFILKD